MKGMPTNCGMEGMHGNSQKRQQEKLQVDAGKPTENLQTKQVLSATRSVDGVRGNKIDIGI
jgi:hypothetical protein